MSQHGVKPALWRAFLSLTLRCTNLTFLRMCASVCSKLHPLVSALYEKRAWSQIVRGPSCQLLWIFNFKNVISLISDVIFLYQLGQGHPQCSTFFSIKKCRALSSKERHFSFKTAWMCPITQGCGLSEGQLNMVNHNLATHRSLYASVNSSCREPRNNANTTHIVP